MPPQAPTHAPDLTHTAHSFQHAVFKTLHASSATLERFALLGDDFAAAIWLRNPVEEQISYVQPGHHTLSYYLGGGYGTERKDQPGVHGAPGRFCSMPSDHESHWRIRGKLHFLHLYFLPERFTQRAVLELDQEPRTLQLAERTYFEDAHIAHWCEALVNQPWHGMDAQLRANDVAHRMLSQLLRSHTVSSSHQKLRGGLAPFLRRRLAEYIDTHLHQPLTLGMLAEVACLSEYHLAHAFNLSFGTPPHAWITARRLERAQQLLRDGQRSLQHIADACGYADLSHFSHRIKAATGVSPRRYRQAMR